MKKSADKDCGLLGEEVRGELKLSELSKEEFEKRVVIILGPGGEEDGLRGLLDCFVESLLDRADKDGLEAAAVLEAVLEGMRGLPGSYDFATIMRSYWLGYELGDEEIMMSAVRACRKVFGDSPGRNEVN